MELIVLTAITAIVTVVVIVFFIVTMLYAMECLVRYNNNRIMPTRNVRIASWTQLRNDSITICTSVANNNIIP